MNLRKYTLACFALLTGGLLLSSCNGDKDTFAPKSGSKQAVEINEVKSIAREGSIKLTWKVGEYTEGRDLLYVEGKYYDPYLHKEVIRLGSENADSLIMPNTFKVAGTYTVTLTPVSSDGNRGTSQTIEVESGAVPNGYELDDTIELVQIPLNVNMLSTNAQEPTEGPIKNLVDGDNNTFFHSAWSKQIDDFHNIMIALDEPVQAIHVKYVNRHNGGGSGDLTKAEIHVSEDGSNWIYDENNPTKIEFSVGDNTRSKVIDGNSVLLSKQGKAYKYIKIVAKGRRNKETLAKGDFFNMAELMLYKAGVKVMDYEAEAAKVINGE